MVLCATVGEARPIARGFGMAYHSGKGVPVWVKGDLGLALAVVGIKANGLGKLKGIAEIGVPKGVILAGLAGGLAAECHAGSVVIDSGAWPYRFWPGGCRLGRILTSETIVATPAEKGKLLLSTGCLAVDMEGKVVRAWAKKVGGGGAAFVNVRGISDTSGEVLDAELLSLIDVEGRLRMGRLVGMILKRPGKIGEMWRLGRVAAMGMRNVREVVRLLVEGGWPGNAEKR